MIDNYHFTKSGAPTYFYDISETVKLGELLYREYNQGYILFLDDKQIIDITNNQEEYIKINIQNQSYSVQQIKSMFKQLMVIRLNNNKKQQKLKFSENDGLIIQSQNNYVQTTIYDFDEWCCVTILKILEDDEYEYIGNYYCENKEFLSFEFETIIQQKYLLINLNKCQMVFYNEYIIKYERVRCLKYLEYLVQQLHQTSFSNFRKIEFFNTLNKQSFLDQFLLKSDVIKWIAQNYDYEENQNYQLFKEIRYKDEIIYKIPEIFIALGKFAKFNYLYIHNQSIAGECLFGSISFEKNEILVDISPSQYFVYFYEGEQEPKFSLKSSIWRNRNPIKDYKIEIINKDKTKLINKIKQEGNIEDGQYVLETENKLYILFSQGMKLVNILNLFIHRIIGDCNQKDENEFYCYDEFCIVSYIKALDQQQYQYQVKFFN